MEEVKIVLSKDLFHGLGKGCDFHLNIGFKQYAKCNNRNHIINTKINGVYVIFDANSGDYHEPNSREKHAKCKSCLYVGEGDIRTRLNSHDNTGRFGKLAEEVVYYKVEDQLERSF